jgi:hypothetical protein
MRETVLAAAVVAWLQSQNHDVYQEVRLHLGGRRADIVVRIPTEKTAIFWVVECKTSLSLALLDQAIKWTGQAHLVSIATPFCRQAFESRTANHVIAHFGVGRIDMKDGAVRQLTPARLHRMKAPEWDAVLNERHKTELPAGSPGGGYWTPYRQTCERIAAWVAKHPGCTMAEAVRGIKEHHYASDASAISNLGHWLTENRVHGVRYEQAGRTRRLWPEVQQCS